MELLAVAPGVAIIASYLEVRRLWGVEQAVDQVDHERGLTGNGRSRGWRPYRHTIALGVRWEREIGTV